LIVRDLSFIVAVLIVSFTVSYFVLRPLQRAQERLRERIDGLEADIRTLRQAHDREFVRAVRGVAPSPLLRHVRIVFRPADLLLQVLTPKELDFFRTQHVSFPDLSIEYWKAHTVFECSFTERHRRRTQKVIAFDTDPGTNISLWQVALGEHPDWPLLSPSLELRYDIRLAKLTFGAVLGRFGSEDHFDHLLPKPEFRFVSLSLTDDGLKGWRIAPDPDDAAAIDRSEWLYECESPADTPVRWNLISRDIGIYDRWSVEITLPASPAAG
jgi:hypothetical protein